jgi:hypothetical protein
MQIFRRFGVPVSCLSVVCPTRTAVNERRFDSPQPLEELGFDSDAVTVVKFSCRPILREVKVRSHRAVSRHAMAESLISSGERINSHAIAR